MNEHYINLGTHKGCCFVFMSKRLLDRLGKFPFLHEAVEESVLSAKSGYYSVGILTFYQLLEQLLNASNKGDSKIREVPAHYILVQKPSEAAYSELNGRFKEEAKKQYLKEIAKEENPDKYINDLTLKWDSIYGISKAAKHSGK